MPSGTSFMAGKDFWSSCRLSRWWKKLLKVRIRGRRPRGSKLEGWGSKARDLKFLQQQFLVNPSLKEAKSIGTEAVKFDRGPLVFQRARDRRRCSVCCSWFGYVGGSEPSHQARRPKSQRLNRSKTAPPLVFFDPPLYIPPVFESLLLKS